MVQRLNTPTVIYGGDGEPEAPDWLMVYDDMDVVQYAQAEWGKIIREMRSAGTLGVENGHAIQRLVDFRIHYEHARREVSKLGPVKESGSDDSPHGRWNPWWSVMKQADDIIRRIENELGISPLRRKSAGKAKQNRTVKKASDAYLSG